MTEAEKLKSAALSTRLVELRSTISQSHEVLQRATMWAYDAPNSVMERKDGEKLLQALTDALDVTAKYPAVHDSGLSVQTGAARKALRAIDNVEYRITRVIDDIRKEYPASDLNPVHDIKWSLMNTIRELTLTVAWLRRAAKDTELLKATAQAERAKRMRARRKAGFRMVSVAVHDMDVEAMIDLGLLKSAERDDPGALEAALQAFHFAAFAAASRNKPDEGPNALAFQRVRIWLGRMGDFWDQALSDV